MASTHSPPRPRSAHVCFANTSARPGGCSKDHSNLSAYSREERDIESVIMQRYVSSGFKNPGTLFAGVSASVGGGISEASAWMEAPLVSCCGVAGAAEAGPGVGASGVREAGLESYGARKGLGVASRELPLLRSLESVSLPVTGFAAVGAGLDWLWKRGCRATPAYSSSCVLIC